MIRIEKIEIKLPKWTWWQAILGIGVLSISVNINPQELLITAKELPKIWLVD